MFFTFFTEDYTFYVKNDQKIMLCIVVLQVDIHVYMGCNHEKDSVLKAPTAQLNDSIAIFRKKSLCVQDKGRLQRWSLKRQVWFFQRAHQFGSNKSPNQLSEKIRVLKHRLCMILCLIDVPEGYDLSVVLVFCCPTF